MTGENKESVFHKMDEARVIRDFADVLCGDDDKRAGVFVASCSRYFEWSGGRLFYKKPGGEKIAATDPSVKEFFATEYPFLLPPPKAEPHEFGGDTVTVAPEIIESALSGSITSKGAIARAFGADSTNSPASRAAAEKTELFLKAEAKKRGGGDGDNGTVSASDNPWSPSGWNLTKQGQLVKALGEVKAAAMAKSAKSFLGATRPTRAA